MMTMGGSYIEQEEGGFRHSYRGYTLPYLKKRYKDAPHKTRNSIKSHIEDGRLYDHLKALYSFLNKQTADTKRKFKKDFPHQKDWYYFFCKVFGKQKKTGINQHYKRVRETLLTKNYPRVTGQERIDLKNKLNPAEGLMKIPLYNYLDRTHAFVWYLDPDEKKLFYRKNPNLERALRVYAISDGRI